MSLKIPNYFFYRDDYTNTNSARSIRGTAVGIKRHLNFDPAAPPPAKLCRNHWCDPQNSWIPSTYFFLSLCPL